MVVYAFEKHPPVAELIPGLKARLPHQPCQLENQRTRQKPQHGGAAQHLLPAFAGTAHQQHRRAQIQQLRTGPQQPNHAGQLQKHHAKADAQHRGKAHRGAQLVAEPDAPDQQTDYCQPVGTKGQKCGHGFTPFVLPESPAALSCRGGWCRRWTASAAGRRMPAPRRCRTATAP